MNDWFINSEEKKMGLVLGGGGARGCYEVGAWQAFEQAGIRFDIVAGTSIGALVGALYTQQTLEPLVDFVWHMHPGAIAQDLFAFPETLGDLVEHRRQIAGYLETYILSRKGMDIAPLKHSLDEMFDYDKFKNSPIDFACMTFNVTQKKPEAYYKSEMTREDAADIVLASASCYPAFPMLEMKGDLYIDGGYWDNVPVDLAANMGAKKVLAINVEGPGVTLPVPRNLDVLVIKPMLPLGNFLDFSREQTVRSMDIGYLETSKFLGLYTGYLFTFTNDNLDDIYFIDQYLAFMFDLYQIPITTKQADNMIRSLVGFHPSSLSRIQETDYTYGELVEALAYSVGLDPVGLYDYHVFVARLLRRLEAIKLTRIPRLDRKGLEWLRSLGKEDILAVLHYWIVKENGMMTESLWLVRHVFFTEFHLAMAWYFLGRVYDRVTKSGIVS